MSVNLADPAFLADMIPALWTRESVRVDLPWSTCAMTDMLRMLAGLSMRERISSTVKLANNHVSAVCNAGDLDSLHHLGGIVLGFVLEILSCSVLGEVSEVPQSRFACRSTPSVLAWPAIDRQMKVFVMSIFDLTCCRLLVLELLRW